MITCEHAGRRVPPAYAACFAGQDAVLESHRGWDSGALPLAQALAARFGVTPVVNEATRLLIDCNRSPGHPRLFSEFTRGLSCAERAAIAAAYYKPHRETVAAAVAAAIVAHDTAVHIGVHSFTPVLDGAARQAEIGLLYDPQRRLERRLARHWQAALRAALPGYRIRLNYPYRGTADGLTTALRHVHPPARYLGIELEVRNDLLCGGTPCAPLHRIIGDTLAGALRESGIAPGGGV